MKDEGKTFRSVFSKERSCVEDSMMEILFAEPKEQAFCELEQIVFRFIETGIETKETQMFEELQDQICNEYQSLRTKIKNHEIVEDFQEVCENALIIDKLYELLRMYSFKKKNIERKEQLASLLTLVKGLDKVLDAVESKDRISFKEDSVDSAIDGITDLSMVLCQAEDCFYFSEHNGIVTVSLSPKGREMQNYRKACMKCK